MNPSDASITQLYNLEANAWEEKLLRLAGIDPRQLAPLQPSGCVVSNLTPSAAKETGLSAGIPIVNGAHDQYCAALGTGVFSPGEVLLSCGTAWVILVVPPTYTDSFHAGMCVSRHAVADIWGGIRSLGGVGASLEWLLDQWWPDQSEQSGRYVLLNQAAEQSPPGANGLIFTPLSGGHLEIGELENRGILGLKLGHTRADLARALMEGIAAELKWTLDEIGAHMPIRRVKMIGGAARSALWAQIVANVTGCPVDLPAVVEAACLGAALLAGVGIGWYPDVPSAWRLARVDQTAILPDPSTRDIYQRLNQKYQKSWEMIPHHADWMAGKDIR